jgi:hypothetical protein
LPSLWKSPENLLSLPINTNFWMVSYPVSPSTCCGGNRHHGNCAGDTFPSGDFHFCLPILTVKSGLICGKLSLNRHCISMKNDPDQKRRSRLSLAAIALANPDGHRLALVPILHYTAEAMTPPSAAEERAHLMLRSNFFSIAWRPTLSNQPDVRSPLILS